MVKFARRVANTAPLKDMVGERPSRRGAPWMDAHDLTVKEVNPGPEVQTDEQWAEWLKGNFSTTWREHSFLRPAP